MYSRFNIARNGSICDNAATRSAIDSALSIPTRLNTSELSTGHSVLVTILTNTGSRFTCSLFRSGFSACIDLSHPPKAKLQKNAKIKHQECIRLTSANEYRHHVNSLIEWFFCNLAFFFFFFGMIQICRQ